MKAAYLLAISALVACSDGQQDNVAEPIALVRITPTQSAQVNSTIRIYGTADAGAAGTFVLSAPEEAVIAAVAAPVGSQVAQGQAIVRLVAGPTSRLELARANTDAQAAQQALARARRLRADGLVGDAEVETARAAAASAMATRVNLAERAGALLLRAPAAGHVSAISAAPGSLVAAGTPIVTIVGTGDLRARFGVDPALARRLAPGSVVRITPSGGGESFSAPVLTVDPAVDPQTRLASLFVRLPAAASLGAGEPLTGDLSLPGGDGAPTIPYAALLDEGGQAYVFVVVGNIAHRRDVTVGVNDGQRAVIAHGLRAGEQVVVEGGTALEDGMRVRTR